MACQVVAMAKSEEEEGAAARLRLKAGGVHAQKSPAEEGRRNVRRGRVRSKSNTNAKNKGSTRRQGTPRSDKEW
jgi:hypothetical protein